MIGTFTSARTPSWCMHMMRTNIEYLEVNEVIESTEFQNWTTKQRTNIIDSDLVFSPAQVTEHHHVELKDQDISQETRDRFDKLKKNILRYFH